MIRLEIADKSRAHVLESLMQKYLYEMTQYYENEMDANGNFEYKYLPLYFVQPDRAAYFIYDDKAMIGFALVNHHSFTGEVIDNSLAEFTIFPAYRNYGRGMQAVDALMNARPGSWQLKYSLRNKPGMNFWKKVQEKYDGVETALEDSEIAITFRKA